MRSKLGFITILLMLAACSSASRTESAEPAPAVGSDHDDYAAIHELYATRQYDEALSRTQGFEKRYPQSGLIADVENLRGLCLLLTRKPAEAVEHFRKAISGSASNTVSLPFLEYNLAKAERESGDFDGAGQTAAKIQPEQLDVETRIKLALLRADIFNQRSLEGDAARQVLDASVVGNSIPIELKNRMGSELSLYLQKISDVSVLETLVQDHPKSFLVESVRARMKALGSSEAATAKPTISSSVDSKAIGVLLPFKGKYAAFAEKNLRAIELAFRSFDKDSPYDLVIADSGEEPDQGVKALDDLVLNRHVIAVIGPLLSKGADMLARRAEELGVPLLSLARRSIDSPMLISCALTAQAQSQEIARFAIQGKSLKRFAILYPKDAMGEEFARTFWDAVESMGGQIVGVESYPPGETDFRQFVDKLSGLYYTEARQKELDALADLRKQNQIKKKTRKTEQYYNLPPVVDYDAVFIPDDPKVSGQILPTFAYRDVDRVLFLGTSAWNSPELVERAQTYAEGAVFVDVFSQGGSSPVVKKFYDDFNAEYGFDPNGMDALAYDAASAVRAALDAAGSSPSRSDLLEKIRHLHDIAGATGRLSYKDGQLTRDLDVLTIKNGMIGEVFH